MRDTLCLYPGNTAATNCCLAVVRQLRSTILFRLEFDLRARVRSAPILSPCIIRCATRTSKIVQVHINRCDALLHVSLQRYLLCSIYNFSTYTYTVLLTGYTVLQRLKSFEVALQGRIEACFKVISPLVNLARRALQGNPEGATLQAREERRQ